MPALAEPSQPPEPDILLRRPVCWPTLIALSAFLRPSVAICGTTASPLESDIGRAGSAVGRRLRSPGKTALVLLMDCIKQTAIIGVSVGPAMATRRRILQSARVSRTKIWARSRGTRHETLPLPDCCLDIRLRQY